MGECIQCGCPVGNKQKFCSPYCRTKHWVAANRVRAREYQRRWREKQETTCKGCGATVPPGRRKSGVTYCSAECQKSNRLKAARLRRREIFKAFAEFKKSVGCQGCGYRKCGACLDYHHREPDKKEFRITAPAWFANTERTRKEMAKCDLLCKNCHYELHDEDELEAGIV